MVNVDFRSEGSAKILSNLYPAQFIFDGVLCESMEGFLQSLKFEDVVEQEAVCKLSGFHAKNIGKHANDWRPTQTLWWKGNPINRHSREYIDLVYRAMLMKFTGVEECKNALMDTGDEKISHTIGNTNPEETILTRSEFCIMLDNIRTKLHTSNFFEM